MNSKCKQSSVTEVGHFDIHDHDVMWHDITRHDTTRRDARKGEEGEGRTVRVCTAGDVVCVPVKDVVVSYHVRGEGGHDVQLAILDKRVVRRGSRHLKLAVPIN